MRAILHSDLNAFFASVECLYRPELLGVPMAVAGDPLRRHGIILAKNQLAKQAGVKTAEAIWEAKLKCPQLVLVEPRYGLYSEYAQRVRALYLEYTDQVEPFGLDEAWLDVTGSRLLFGSGPEIAETLRRRVREETGLTISVGVSYNKAFAKLGSDYKKPDAVTVIDEAAMRTLVWPLPVGELLFVGPATVRALDRRGVYTIGELAAVRREQLTLWLGKAGETLWRYANGLDASPVARWGESSPIKSVSNSCTPPHDLRDEEELHCLVYLLCDKVAARLRSHGLEGRRVELSFRDEKLRHGSRQTLLAQPTALTETICRTAESLLWQNGATGPLRSVGVGVGMLEPARTAVQYDLCGEQARLDRAGQLEDTMDALRARFGKRSIGRAVFFTRPELTGMGAPLF